MKIVAASLAACGALVFAGVAYAGPPAGDAERGRTVFARCAACHDAKTGANRVGPSLKGVVGRRAASNAGYGYSAALKNKNVTWTPATLDAFLTAPTRFAPGTRMSLPVGNPKDRADLIAYLATLR
ncbi:MAG: cytochrome c family protein [Sphingomonadales bacterium]|nr:cytochrome c family protein [Sphingomonadales bacterium]